MGGGHICFHPPHLFFCLFFKEAHKITGHTHHAYICIKGGARYFWNILNKIHVLKILHGKINHILYVVNFGKQYGW